MAFFKLRIGDGNEGNFARQIVEIAEDQNAFAALEALVLNTYIEDHPIRKYVEENIQTEGETAFGIYAMVYEGPEGETAYGAAWLTAELEANIDEDEESDARTLADLLDGPAMAYYLARSTK